MRLGKTLKCSINKQLIPCVKQYYYLLLVCECFVCFWYYNGNVILVLTLENWRILYQSYFKLYEVQLLFFNKLFHVTSVT